MVLRKALEKDYEILDIRPNRRLGRVFLSFTFPRIMFGQQISG